MSSRNRDQLRKKLRKNWKRYEENHVNWYAVRTKPRQVREAETNLVRMGIETFCPQITERKIIRRRWEFRTGPLFPGYLFAKFDIERHYRTVHYARGVRGVVMFGSMPAAVDDGMIEAIRARLHSEYLTLPQSRFVQGQVVRIEQGPLHGLEAIFEREMSGGQRAVLLLRALAYQARVVVDIRDVINL